MKAKNIIVLIFVLLLGSNLVRSQSITLYGEVLTYKDSRSGIDFSMEPRISAKWGGLLFDASNIVCKLESLGPRNDDNPTPIRINYKGNTYDFFSFNRELVPFFEKLIIRSVHITLETNNLTDCPEIIGTDIQLGGTFSRFCTPKTNKSNVSLTIKSIKISKVDGIGELLKKIDELENEKKNQEQNKEKVDQFKKEADKFFDERKYDLAIEKYDNILEIEPSNQYAQLRRNSAERELKTKGNTSQQRKSNTTINNNNSSSSAGQSELRRRQAMALEREGDNYYNQNNIAMALEKYRAAQGVFYTTEVENKIKNLQGLYSLAENLNKIGDALDNAIEKADPKQTTNFTHVALRYEQGFQKTNYSENLSFKNTKSITVDAMYHRLFMSFGFRFGYNETQSILTNIRMSKQSIVGSTILNEKASVQTSGFNLGLSGGLNIPINVNRLHINLYALYGYDMNFFGKTSMNSLDFLLEDESSNVIFIQRYTFGINWQIPKSTVGFGISYNLLSINDPGSYGNELIYTGNNQDYLFNPNGGKTFFNLDEPVDKKNIYSSFSISFLWQLPRRVYK